MEKTNKNNQWKEVSLTDLLDKEDLKIVFKLIKKNDWDTLRIYLHSIDEKLIKKECCLIIYSTHYRQKLNEILPYPKG